MEWERKSRSLGCKGSDTRLAGGRRNARSFVSLRTTRSVGWLDASHATPSRQGALEDAVVQLLSSPIGGGRTKATTSGVRFARNRAEAGKSVAAMKKRRVGRSDGADCPGAGGDGKAPASIEAPCLNSGLSSKVQKNVFFDHAFAVEGLGGPEPGADADRGATPESLGARPGLILGLRKPRDSMTTFFDPELFSRVSCVLDAPSTFAGALDDRILKARAGAEEKANRECARTRCPSAISVQALAGTAGREAHRTVETRRTLAARTGRRRRSGHHSGLHLQHQLGSRVLDGVVESRDARRNSLLKSPMIPIRTVSDTLTF